MIGPVGLTVTFTDMDYRLRHRDLGGAMLSADAEYTLSAAGVIRTCAQQLRSPSVSNTTTSRLNLSNDGERSGLRPDRRCSA